MYLTRQVALCFLTFPVGWLGVTARRVRVHWLLLPRVLTTGSIDTPTLSGAQLGLGGVAPQERGRRPALAVAVFSAHPSTLRGLLQTPWAGP